MGCLVLMVLFGELALLLANLHTRRRAESLLALLRPLKVGTSTLQDIQPILATYKVTNIGPSSTCPSAEENYDVNISNGTIGRLVFEHPTLLKIGARPVHVEAVLHFTGGHLCEFRYSVSAFVA